MGWVSKKIPLRYASAKKMDVKQVVIPRALAMYTSSKKQASFFVVQSSKKDEAGLVSFRDVGEGIQKQQYPVVLPLRSCPCMGWLNMGVPCGHAVAVADFFSLPYRDAVGWREWGFAERFRVEKVVEAYSLPLYPVGSRLPNIPDVVLRPFALHKVNRSRGRPVSNRIKGPEERGKARGAVSGNASAPAAASAASATSAGTKEEDETIKPIPPQPLPKTRKPRKQESCTACKELGHRKTSKRCPNYVEPGKEPSSVEQVE